MSRLPPPHHPELVQLLRRCLATRDEILSMTLTDLRWAISEIRADIEIADAVGRVRESGSG